MLRAPWGPRSPGGFWPLCLHFLREPCSPSGWLCARQGLQLLGEQSTRWCRPALAKRMFGVCSGCVPSPTSTTQPQRAPGSAPRIQVPLLALNVLYPVKPRGKPRRKTSPDPAAVGCFSLQRLPQLPNPPGTRLSGSCHHPRPPAAVPGGSPPRLLGPLPSRWRIASQELLISSPEPGGAAWERAGGGRQVLRGGSGASAAPAAFSHLPALPSTSWQPGAW